MTRLPSTGRPGVIALALTALAACDGEFSEAPVIETAPAAPRGSVAVVETFGGFGAEVADLVVIPAPVEPWKSRAIVALSNGEFALIDLSLGAVETQPGVQAAALVAAPQFALRGAPTPLLVAAGEEASAGQAFLFVADEGTLLPAPIEPLADAGLIGLCPLRATDSALEVVTVTASDGRAVRILDRGRDALAVEPSDRPLDTAQTCVDRLQRDASGLGIASSEDEDAVADTAHVDAAARAIEIETVPGQEVLRVTAGAPGAPAVDITMVGGMNASPSRPVKVAATASNVGGSYGAGVVLVADETTISVIALDDLLAAFDAALDATGGS